MPWTAHRFHVRTTVTQVACLSLLLLLELARIPAVCSQVPRQQGKRLRDIASSNGWNIPSWYANADPCDIDMPWDGVKCEQYTIVSLNLTNRNLKGDLPSDLFSALPNLTHLLLGQNSFTGSLPESLFELTSLTQLDLSYNSFSGSLPSDYLVRLQNLQVLSLTSNKFDAFDLNFSKLKFLQYLLLGKNGCKVQFSDGADQLLEILAIDLEGSFLVGGLPKDLWSRPLLQVLVLAGTNFGPKDLPSLENISPSLKYLSLPNGLRAPPPLQNLVQNSSRPDALCNYLPQWIPCFSSLHPPGSPPFPDARLSVGAVVGVTLASTVLLCVCVGLGAVLAYKRWQNNKSDEDSSWLRREAGPASSDPSVEMGYGGRFMVPISGQIFTYRELQFASNGFDGKHQIGEGGFGRVYRAMLASGKVVAIKQMDEELCGAQGEREFRVEVDMLSRLCHPNLVRLLGYCADSRHRLIVYEYMQNGSLHDYFEAKQVKDTGKKLDMQKRLLIAYGAAKALEYLHSGGGLGSAIIHRDFKASNILLDSGLQARVSDFGLARIMPGPQKTHVSTRVIGTFGYFDPEYTATGQLTKKSDVYAFGVVLLQLLTGKAPIVSADEDEVQGIVSWAFPALTARKKMIKMLDPDLGDSGDYSVRSALKLANLARLCVKDSSADRPSMLECVKILEKILLEANSFRQRGRSFRRLVSLVQ